MCVDCDEPYEPPKPAKVSRKTLKYEIKALRKEVEKLKEDFALAVKQRDANMRRAAAFQRACEDIQSYAMQRRLEAIGENNRGATK